jgi:nucleoside-diphosphate-sugar epimerase
MERSRPAYNGPVGLPRTSLSVRHGGRPSVPSPLAAAPFAERERIAAERFAAAAIAAGVRRIVYLGALQPRPAPGARSGESAARSPAAGPPSSRHLASRKAVEGILLDAVPDSVALRASIVIGARSRSFRLLVHLLERLPVLALPAWRRFRTQPIDARDVIELLVASASARVPARRLDVGGPDVLSYGELITRIAELMLVNRPSLELGVNLTPVAASVAAAITGEDPQFVTALMESLDGDLLPADDRARELLNVPLHSLEAAIEHALSEWEEFEPLAAR